MCFLRDSTSSRPPTTNYQQTNYPQNQEGKNTTMKIKINWKELGKQLWDAVKPVLLGAIGGGLVTLANGCSSLTPSAKTQTMSLYAIGIPGIAVVS